MGRARATPGDSEVAEFAKGFREQIVRPGDPDYDAARAVWNCAIDRYPAIVVRCTGAADVIRSVRFAREQKLVVAVGAGRRDRADARGCDGLHGSRGGLLAGRGGFQWDPENVFRLNQNVRP